MLSVCPPEFFMLQHSKCNHLKQTFIFPTDWSNTIITTQKMNQFYIKEDNFLKRTTDTKCDLLYKTRNKKCMYVYIYMYLKQRAMKGFMKENFISEKTEGRINFVLCLEFSLQYSWLVLCVDFYVQILVSKGKEGASGPWSWNPNSICKHNFFLRVSFVRLHVWKLEPVPLSFTEWNLFYYTAETVSCYSQLKLWRL